MEKVQIMRRKTRPVKVGRATIGGGAPVSVQSMTTTFTHDVKGTVEQVMNLIGAGADIVRITIPDEKSADGFKQIRAELPNANIVADIHFDWRMAMRAVDYGADKIRINPGTIGKPEHVKEIVRAVKDAGIAMRLGVNIGSLEREIEKEFGRGPEAIVESAKRWIGFLESLDFTNFVVSLKSSDVLRTVAAYRLLANEIDYPFHLGITEAGTEWPGTIKSSVGLGALLVDGIGDTIRVSLAADPIQEVKVGLEILKVLGLRMVGREIIACPSCGRTEIDLIPLAQKVEKATEKMKQPLKIAVMGCTVNGPGEAKEADYGITGGKGKGVIFRKGKVVKVCDEIELLPELLRLIEVHEGIKL